MVRDLDTAVAPVYPQNSSFTVQQRLKGKSIIVDEDVNKEYSEKFKINIVSLVPLNDMTTGDKESHHTNTPADY